SVVYSPDGATIASGGTDDDSIKLWNAQTGTLLRTLAGHTHYVYSVAFSPDGTTIASGSWDNTIKLWNAQTGTLLHTLAGHTNGVSSVVYSPDGATIASGGTDDDSIKLWNAQTGTLFRTLSSHTNGVRSVVYSPDGETLASGSLDNTIKLWDVSSGALLRTLTGHSSYVFSAAFSPDGETLASGSWDGTIKLWNAQTGTLVRTLTGYASLVWSVAFSPDSETLMSGSRYGTITLWDVKTGTLLRTLTGHTSHVYSVAFSPAGVTLASGSSDGTVLLWDVYAILPPNDSPTATFTWQALSSTGTRLVVEPRTGDRIEFDASDSSDADDEIVEYAWDWSSNGHYDSTTGDPVIEHTFSSAGSHRVTLRVTDDDGATATVTKTVNIGAKQSPNAAFSFSPFSPSSLNTVQFTDSSSDPDGSISSWQWNFGDGSSSTDRNPNHRFTDKGTFAVQLTVTDNDDLTDSTTQTVTVRNLLPEARFSYEPLSPQPQQPITFDAGESYDSDGEILSYRWDFDGDGAADREGSAVTWTFTEAGEYAVVLEVTDDD
ncbi:MAG: PKD domain-containing protein, partial [Lentisphaeria bacterium]|nr:PKD domain-containing protein [Lentisphaeria bacterium]